jgi:hypothetical protein
MSPRRVAQVMAALLLLSACETLMSQAPGAPVSPAPPAPAPPPPPPRPAAPSPAAQPQAAVPAETPRIEGLRREEILERLGPPAAERDAAPAKVLDYKATGCEVAVYLYFDTGRGGFFALHYEINGRPAPTRDTDRCLRAIAQGAKRG